METYNPINPKPVNFKFGEYINQGFEFFKQNVGDHVIAFLLMFVMSIIPFCSFLAMGNYYKFCRKMKNGQKPSPSEIFNFDDFVPYLILQLILTGVVFVLYIPFLLVILFSANSAGSEPSPIMGIFMMIYLVAFLVALFYIIAKAFYMVGLISLNRITDLKQAWNISKTMTTGNLLMIVLFAIATSFIGQLGILLCGIGIFLTMPIYYLMNYFAQEDGLAQISGNEINEIGNSEY